MRLPALGRLEENRFHGKQIAKSKVKVDEFYAEITLQT